MSKLGRGSLSQRKLSRDSDAGALAEVGPCDVCPALACTRIARAYAPYWAVSPTCAQGDHARRGGL